VKTISVPINKAEKTYSAWQEGKRKAIERAFGIAQRKWQILCHPVEQWYEDEINDIVETCFILHNMMVEVRLGRDQLENVDWYELVEASEADNNDDGEEDTFIGRHVIDIDDDNLQALKPSLSDGIKLITDRWPMPCTQ
jgi:Plant transposon protein